MVVPLRLGGGHRAATELRWVSGPVYTKNHKVRAASVKVRIGGGVLRAPLSAVLYGQSGRAIMFDQTPLRAMEGMPAG